MVVPSTGIDFEGRSPISCSTPNVFCFVCMFSQNVSLKTLHNARLIGFAPPWLSIFHEMCDFTDQAFVDFMDIVCKLSVATCSSGNDAIALALSEGFNGVFSVHQRRELEPAPGWVCVLVAATLDQTKLLRRCIG